MDVCKYFFIFVLPIFNFSEMSNKTEITIHDLAKKLNISASTVSRALNDNPRISQKTRDTIKAAALELGYQPNTIASNLRNRKSNTIGIVVPLINRHFFSSVISGVEDVAFAAGYNVVISQSNDEGEKEQRIVRSMFANRVDGLIISIAMKTTEFEHLQLFSGKKIPLVFFDRIVKDIESDRVVVDDFSGGYKVTKHLIEQDCKRIAHLTGPLSLQTYSDRKRGYLEALRDHNQQIDEELIIVNNLTKADGLMAIKQLLKLENRPDGIFCGNDTTALSAIIYLKEVGIKVPDEIAIVGYSNEPFSEVVTPSISTIKQPGFEMGQKAAQMLIKQIENKDISIKFETVTMPNELVIRESSLKK